MFGKLKELVADSTVLSFALMGNKLVAILLFPLFARFLSLSEYGVWDLTNSLAAMLTLLCILGLDSALAFHHFETNNNLERKRYFTTALLFPFILGTGLVLAAFFFSAPLASVFYPNHPTEYTHLLFYAVASVLANIVIHQVLTYARIIRRVWMFTVGTWAYVIGSSLWSLTFVVAGLGVTGIFIGQTVGQWSVALMLLWLFRDQLTRSVRLQHLQHMLTYGLPLVPALLAFWIMSALSRPLIYHWISAEAAGLFGTAVRIASLILLFTSAFQFAWRPFAHSIKNRPDADRIYSMVGRGFLVGATFCLLLLTWSAEPMLKMLTGRPEYTAAYPYVWVLALGTILHGMHGLIGIRLFTCKKTRAIARSFIIAAILYFIGTILFIPWWEIWAPTVMTAASYGFALLLIYRQAQQMHPIDFRMPSMLIYLSICVFCFSLLTWAQMHHWEYRWAVGLLFLFFIPSAVFFTGVFRWRTLSFLYHRLPRLTQ
jgi:O-antigen/teichoic acid export membrane protein